MSDVDKQLDEIIDTRLSWNGTQHFLSHDTLARFVKPKLKALIEREVREAKDEYPFHKIQKHASYKVPIKNLDTGEVDYDECYLLPKKWVDEEADRIKQLRGDTFLTLPDDEKRKVLKKAVKKANEEQRKLLENRSSDWLDEVVHNIANFYSKREFTLDGGDYVGVEKAKRDIRKHIGCYLKTIAENNGAYIIDGEAYGITKVDSIKAPLGGDDE